MKTTWTILLGIIFFATACAPNPVYRLYSEEKQNVSWNHGSEMIQLQQDSLFVTLSYYRHLDEEVIFDVEMASSAVFSVSSLSFEDEGAVAVADVDVDVDCSS